MYGGRASVTSQPPLSAASCSNLLCLSLIFFVFCYKLLLNKPTSSTLLRTHEVKLHFRLYFIYLLCLLFLFKICVFIVSYTILCMKYCYKGLNKQSSGVRERIINFTLILMGKWFRFPNKSIFEQPLGTNYVRQPRFHCTCNLQSVDPTWNGGGRIAYFEELKEEICIIRII
jgi:hypothetical protein